MKKYFIIVLAAATLATSKTNAQDPNWVKINTWYFDNFTKPILPWSMFRETYIGVAPAPSADFDQLFYDLLYKDQLAAKGYCYGLSTMAMLMMKNGGHLGYCHPASSYSGTIASPAVDTTGPADPNLKTALGLVHGNQINHGFLSFLLDVIAIGKNRDGRYAYDMVNFYLAKNDPPVISVTKGLSPADGGHVIVPFFTKDFGATKRIYVYDCNRSYYKPGADGKDWYDNLNNYIEVTTATGAWKFNMGSSGSPSFWTGDPGSGGNCLVIPLSVAGRRDRLPQSLLADGAYALNTIFIFGNVKMEQITDPVSKRNYFNQDGSNVEPCEEKRLNTIMPFIPLTGGGFSKGTAKTKAYFFRGADPLELQFRAYGYYRIGMLFKGKYVEMEGKGDGSVQRFRADK